MESRPPAGLETPIRYLKGVGEVRAEQLAKLGIATVGDLLLTLPNRYEDRRHVTPLSGLKSGEFVTVAGKVVSAGWIQPRFGKGFYEAVLSDGSGFARCRWFQASWLKDQVKQGDRLLAYAKVLRQKGETVLSHPDFEILRDDEEDADRASLHIGRIVPVYGLTESLPQRILRRIAWNAVTLYAGAAREFLPDETVQRWNLLPPPEAIRAAHFPETMDESRRGRYRLAFEEFLCMQLVLVARKIRNERFVQGISHKAPGALRRRFLESLPFQLTGAQRKALEEGRGDMEKPRPMHRLLQGDVGSGKTVVAACAALDAIEAGSQVAVMSPTEILASQHFKTFSRYLSPLGITMTLLSGSLSPQEKTAARAALVTGRTQLVVGTHALIQDRVEFKRLGLIVIDEQHKFGVEQRGLLYEKGAQPDVLVMTATPIPRTLAMTLYGDLDATVMDEMPAGRQQIVTKVVKAEALPKVYGFIRDHVAKGRQAYIVYPLVAESEQLELKSAESMYNELSQTHLKGLRLGLLHGQMDAEAKDRVMQRFRAGAVDVLVSTTVIEVGVDVPNATIMLVENAERFGLAQLHQLRGRIGRGEHKSYCILEGSPGSLDAWKRLKVMEETTDGFRIAEEDFRIRGMGNLLGREQSGFPILRVGDPLADVKILEAARREAFTLVEQDPEFRNPAYDSLRERSRALFRSAAPYVKVG